jgi:pimeloyl-CoA dehydrogenase small subunit
VPAEVVRDQVDQARIGKGRKARRVMDFGLNSEQQLLKDSVDRLLADKYTFEKRKAIAASVDGWSRELWAQYADLGLLGVTFSEEHGGIGGGPVETMIVMEALGRSIALEPYVPTVVIGGGFIQAGGTDKQKDEMLPAIAAGKLLLAFAYTERQSRFDLFDVATTARKEGDSWVLDGAKAVVWHGDSADKIIVTARVSGQQRDKDGIGLFIIDAKAAGLTVKPIKLGDSHRGADLLLRGVKVAATDVIGEPGRALPLIERVIDRAIAATIAEAIGCMDEMLAVTVDYLKTREQFGRPIGTFQALQHRAVDMLMNVEQARSMSILATMMADQSDNSERRRSISGAKVHICKASRYVGEQAIQLHGGIAMTMEYKAGHYFRRLLAIQTMFGDLDQHMELLSDAGGFAAGDD